MQYHPLPVPADSFIQGNWVNDPYKVPLPIPAKPIFQQRPDLQWVLSLTAAVLVNNLQDNCQNSPISIFAYNLFSSNGFNNQYFLTICDEASDFALQQLGVAQQGQDPAGVVTTAVRFYATYATAKCAFNFPALQQYLTPDMGARINQVVNQWNQLSGGISQQPAHQPQAGMYQPQTAGYQQPNTGYSSMTASPNIGVPMGAGVASMAFNPATTQEDSKFGAAATGDNRPRPAARVKPNEELQSLGVTEVGSGYHGSEQKVEVVATHRPTPVAHTDTRVRPAGRVVRDTSGPVPESIPAGVTIASDIPDIDVFAPEEQEDIEWASRIEFGNEPREEYVIPAEVQGHWLFRPKHSMVDLPTSFEEADLEDPEDLEVLDIVGTVENEEDPFAILKLRGDLLAVRVTATDPGRTWSIEQPHNHPYDPLEHFRYLVKGDGDECFEAFLPRDENVEYTDLEFDDAKRAKARMDAYGAKNVLADTSVITEIKPRGVPYTIIGAVDNLDKAHTSADHTKLLDEVEKFQGKLSFFESTDKSLEIGDAQFLVERFHERVGAKNAVPATSGHYDRQFLVPDFATKADSYSSAASQNRLSKLLLMIGDLREASPRAFIHLNNILTKEVNNVLSHALGLEEYTITDFADDYFDLCTTVEEERSEAVLLKLNEAVGVVLGGIDMIYKDGYLTLRHVYRIMGLPIGLSSFNLATNDGTFYRVVASVTPDLYTLISALEQDEASAKRGKNLLFGADGQLMEVVASIWDEGFLTLLPA